MYTEIYTKGVTNIFWKDTDHTFISNIFLEHAINMYFILNSGSGREHVRDF